jgi:hypothetical protein
MSSFNAAHLVEVRMNDLMKQYRLQMLQRLTLFSRRQTRGPLVKPGVQLTADDIRQHLERLRLLVNLPGEIVTGRLTATSLPMSIDSYFPDWVTGSGSEVASLTCEFLQWARDRLVLVADASLDVEKAPGFGTFDMPFEGSAIVVCRTPYQITYPAEKDGEQSISVFLVSCLTSQGVPVVRIRPLHTPRPSTNRLVPGWTSAEWQQYIKDTETKPSQVHATATKELAAVQTAVENLFLVDGLGYGQCSIDLVRSATAPGTPGVRVLRNRPRLTRRETEDQVRSSENHLAEKCFLAFQQIMRALAESRPQNLAARRSVRGQQNVTVTVEPFVLPAHDLFVVDRVTSLKPRRATTSARAASQAHTRVLLSAPIKVEAYYRRPQGKGSDPTAARTVLVKSYEYNRTPAVTIGRGMCYEA